MTSRLAPRPRRQWINLSADAHPIHVHKRFFQVVKVEAVTIGTTADGELSWTIGDEVPPAPFEVACRAGAGQCQEDTILVYAGTATTVRIAFPGRRPTGANPPDGLFQWHWCAGRPSWHRCQRCCCCRGVRAAGTQLPTLLTP